MKIISRGKGQSAVASAAYRSGTKLRCKYYGETMDFSRKTGVVYSEVFLPPHAPPEYKDRELLWNAVEASEKQKNAQLARDIEFSLPVELQRKDQIAAAREMAEYFCRQGMAVDLNIHNPDRSVKNPHCHLMLTMRPFEEDGSFVKYKSRRVYDLDSSGNRIPNRDGTDFKSHKVNVTDWDNKENMEKWRAEWTKIAQSYLDRDHADVRMEHRSYEKQGLKLIPTVHIGPAVTAMERRGIRTEVGDLNRQIRAVNEETIMLEKRIAEIDGMLANLDAELLKQDEKSKLLQSAGFTSTEELFQAVKKTRQDHSALSVQRKELIEKMRGQTHLVDISEEYKQYFNEEAILRQVFAHNLDSHHDRVCFHAYLRFLIENKGDLTGIDEWMRVIHNLSHPESTIMNEGTHMASAIKSVEAMLPYSKDILGYLKGDPSIGAFSAWQSLEEKVKAHLITRSQAWEVLIERTEKHGYFNGQIGFLLSFSGILDYYLQDKRYCCDWSEEEDKRYYASFKDYAEKACLVFMYDYDHRENDNDYVFERAVFTKGNYIGVSTAWRRNLFSTSVGKNNVRRDHSWKRFLRMTEDPEWRQYQNFVKAVFDDPRFDKSNVHDSLLTICQDLTMTWRDLFIQEPEMFAYCEQGFLHYVNDNRIILLSQSQYNHYHAELYTYFLWKNVLEERISMYPLFKEIWYYQVKNSEDEPGICFSDYIHNRINYELSIYYEETEDETGGQYELCFYKKHRSNAHLEDYPDDMAAILEDAGFYWDEENEYFHCLFKSSTDLLERIDSFYKNLSFELSV